MVRSAVVVFCWLIITLFCLRWEYLRLSEAVQSEAGVLSWLVQWDAETTLPLLCLLLLPVLVFVKRPLAISKHRPEASEVAAGLTGNALKQNDEAYVVPGRYRLLGVVIVFAAALCASFGIGQQPVSLRQGFDTRNMRFQDLPPAYHDEFSYLVQARTFLAGRLAWLANHIQPDLFHQFHVLNRPTTASRYFPWTGVWMAPFELAGYPYWGHWLAGAIASVFFFLSLAQLLSFRWSLMGGLLIATSPGIAIFSNLLLAHHPTMMALSVFLWAFFRLMKSGHAVFAFVAGLGLSLAMLGRPMTAAGFALPFGIWLLAMLASRKPAAARRLGLQVVLGFAVPLGAGFVCLAVLNHSITGSWKTSAYQLYTDTWTPHHRFGFNNGLDDGMVTNEVVSSVEAIEAYDRWARENNLTPTRAVRNVSTRAMGSLQWSLGIVPLVLFLSIVVLMCFVPARRGGVDLRVWLLVTSVICLHLVHIPYWYDGIMGWHYVFETAPLLLMLCIAGSTVFASYLEGLIGKRLAFAWVVSLILTSWVPGWVSLATGWGPSKVGQAVNQLSYSRTRMQQFRWLMDSPAVTKPALILVDESGSDPQLSFIVNAPDLTGDWIVCRLPASEDQMNDLRNAFNDRFFYRFDPRTFTLNAAND